MNFKDVWNSAAEEPKQSFSHEDLPDGNYIVEVISFKRGKTKAGDKDMFSWDLKVVEGEQENNHIWVNRPFSMTDDSDQNIKAIKRAQDDFKALELPCTNSEINNSIKLITGKTIEINLRTGDKGQFQNFKRIVPPKEEVKQAIPALPVDEEDPF